MIRKRKYRLGIITGVHSDQDQIWLVKIGEYIGFYVYRRSRLLWSPVNTIILYYYRYWYSCRPLPNGWKGLPTSVILKQFFSSFVPLDQQKKGKMNSRGGKKGRKETWREGRKEAQAERYRVQEGRRIAINNSGTTDSICIQKKKKKTSAVRSRISSKLIFANCVG